MFKAYVDKPEYNPPRHKLIASGDEEFCNEKLSEHLSIHENATGGVIYTDKPGDPWFNEWPAGE